MKRKVKQKLKKYLVKYQIWKIKRHERKKFQNFRRKKIWKSIKLTKEQKQLIDSYFVKHYGRKIPYVWHRHFSAFTGHFDHRFIPESIYMVLDRLLSNSPYQQAIEDKNNLFFLTDGISNVSIPITYLSKINGIYRSHNLECISIEVAQKIIQNIGRCFIKPSIDSNSGRGCQILDINGEVDLISGRPINEILLNYGKDFIIQEFISPHESIGIFNKTSANTFRVITYILKDGTIKNTPTTFRMGRKDKYLDNAHQGGIFLSVSDNGKFGEFAFTEFNDKFSEHPDSHIKFKGYEIERMGEILEVCKKMHARIPQVRIVNWDITISSNNIITVLEANCRAGGIWLPQMSSGVGAFGNDIWELLEEVRGF